jgi:hypothetical protein
VSQRNVAPTNKKRQQLQFLRSRAASAGPASHSSVCSINLGESRFNGFAESAHTAKNLILQCNLLLSRRRAAAAVEEDWLEVSDRRWCKLESTLRSTTQVLFHLLVFSFAYMSLPLSFFRPLRPYIRLFTILHYQHLKCCSVGACSPLFALVSPTDAQPGVMRHGLNASYYANQNKPIRAIQEAGAAVRDAVTGSRQ